MRDTALVIMAAGIGSRFGNGIKQLQKIGPGGEIIMDYSIHDAIETGFNKIIFIIRKDIEQDFKDIIGHRIEEVCKRLQVRVEYAFQSIQDVPEGVNVPPGRTKPWGTGQAVLAARSMIHEPFAVINADDYYGKQSFQLVHDYLVELPDPDACTLCMAGYHLKNTLSDYGSVTRGVCRVDEESYLLSIHETREIHKEGSKILSSMGPLEADACVSMNMFGLTEGFLRLLEEGFVRFFQDDSGSDAKKEFLVPIFIGHMLEDQKVSVKVLETHDRWFGITYQEDVEGVMSAFYELYRQGTYQKDLFGDLLGNLL